MNQITRDDAVRAIGRDVGDDFLPDWLAAANADWREDASWLPYYKLAIGMLSSACGMLVETARYQAKCRRDAAALDIVLQADEIFELSCRVTGVGPQTDPKAVERIEKALHEVREVSRKFRESCRLDPDGTGEARVS